MFEYFKLIGSGPNDLSAAIHGGLGIILLASFIWAVEAVLNKSPEAFKRLKIGSIVMAAASFLTIAYGNIIYIAYRAKDGVQPWLKANNIYWFHTLGMEFKEFAALFSFPLAIAIAYTLFTMSDDWFKSDWARKTVKISLFIAIFFTFSAFILGAAVTKAKAI
ncbi:hypothetical protein [Desulfitobacterium sp.]|uniref:hypothetical protein n=1 Tax=Desulfitobacterium sp. TaxID=49981 RepID=UPI002B77C723|nr:hypothetical protein [Desulfitobacterium sp.]HVJ49862.1 hypothetical protein [Desulfitobacterium sp.]